MKNLLTLFLSFLKIGAFTFGGGYAMLPLIQQEVINKHKFIDEKQLLDIFAISETTPGVIAVNTATFIGYRIAGFWGAVISTLGVVLPSFIIILIIWHFMEIFKSNQWINYAFSGIKIAVIVLIFNAGLKLNKSSKKNIFSIVIMSLAFLLILFTGINVIYLILAGVLSGIVYCIFINRRKDQKEDD